MDGLLGTELPKGLFNGLGLAEAGLGGLNSGSSLSLEDEDSEENSG